MELRDEKYIKKKPRFYLADFFKLEGTEFFHITCRNSNKSLVYECEKGGNAGEIEEAVIASIRHYGIPDEFCTDGGSQYTSERLTNLLERYKIEQKTSSPYHARGNQHAEQSVKAAKKALSGWGKYKHKSKAFRDIRQNGRKE